MIAFALALAAAATGSREDADYDSKEVREVAARYGECIIKKRRAAAQQFVLKPDMDEREYRGYAQRVTDVYCLFAAAKPESSIEMKFPGDTMRYALADALVKREFQGAPLPSIKDAAPLAQLRIDDAVYGPPPGKELTKAQLEELAEKRTKWQVVAYAAGLGECVVRAEPNKSYELLMARLNSAEEGAAFQALGPALSQCVTAGQKIRLNKTLVRGTVALNYYRLAHAPRAAVQAAGATN